MSRVCSAGGNGNAYTAPVVLTVTNSVATVLIRTVSRTRWMGKTMVLPLVVLFPEAAGAVTVGLRETVSAAVGELGGGT